MDKIEVLLIIVLVLSIASVSNAINLIYVDVNGPNDPGTGTSNDPFRRIQNAIDAAHTGDIIEIRPGIYTADPNNYNLDPNGKSITIRSTDPNDPNVVANTIIDPNRAGRGFYIHSGEDANCIISGLTINSGEDESGGGVLCDNSSPTINNCIIKNGHATDSGGGLCCDCSDSRIINCIITGNSAEYYGGGISCIFCDPVIVGCVISDNNAVEEGGGIDCWYSNPTVNNCIITGNEAYEGGGVNCYFPGQANLVNCTLAANFAVGSGGGVCCEESEVTIRSCILWANSGTSGPQIALEPFSYHPTLVSISYSGVQGGEAAVHVDPCSILIWGSGNIDADPCFASFDANGDASLWDFHLQSLYGRWDPNSKSWVSDSNTSLCIDAGDPNSDWSDEPWPNGKRINMGAYGGTIQASMNGNLADFDIDGTVNFMDFAALASKWVIEDSCIEDLSGNDVVDFADLGKFAANWLWQRE